MLNEERVKLMTRMASYEATDGPKNEKVAGHFRSDYVGLEVVKAIICATIAFMIIFGAYIYYDFENFMVEIYKLDLWEFAGKILKYYAEFVVVYCVLVYIGFTVKFQKAKKNLKLYFNNLKRLNAFFAAEKNINRENEK